MLSGIFRSHRERCGKIVPSGGYIPNEVCAVSHKYIPPGICIGVGNIGFQFHGTGFIPPGVAIGSPYRTIWCFNLGMQKGAFMHIESAVRPPGVGTYGVVGILSAKAM